METKGTFLITYASERVEMITTRTISLTCTFSCSTYGACSSPIISGFLIDFMPATFQEMTLIASLGRTGTFPRNCRAYARQRRKWLAGWLMPAAGITFHTIPSVCCSYVCLSVCT